MRTERGFSFAVAVVMIVGLVASLSGASYLVTKAAVGGTVSSVPPATVPVLPVSVLGKIASSASNKIVAQTGDPDMPQGVAPETNLGYEQASATYGNHIVISEFATRGPNGAYDEFVELYNPTNAAIDIGNWTLDYYSPTTGTWTTGYITTFSAGATIASCGFYLWGNSSGYSGPTADRLTACTGLSDGPSGAPRALRLAKSDGTTVVDQVGWELDGGTAYDQAEGGLTAPSRLTSNDSISVERKANAISTAATLKSGGADALKGNNYDTNVNFSDWVRQTNGRNPQNTASALETPDNSLPIEVTPAPSAIDNLRGTQSQFIVTVKNNTTTSYTFDLVATDTQGWTKSIVPSSIVVAGNGGTNSATLTVTIADNALVNDIDAITVKATAQGFPTIFQSGSCQLTVISMPVNLVLNPHDDAEIQEENPDYAANSADTRIGARTVSGGLNHRSYIKFDLSGIPPNAVIHDAVLRLYQYSSSSYSVPSAYIAGVCDQLIKKVANDSWDEETITWNTAKDYNPLGNNVNTGGISRSVIITNERYVNRYVDITDYVKTSFVAGDSGISLGIVCQVENAGTQYSGGYYDSKEYVEQMNATNAPSYLPELQLSFESAENITVTITPDNYRQYLGAGRSFDVTVKNWSDVNPYTVDLEVIDTLGWPVSLDTTNFDLDPLASQTVTLTVDVPAGASIGANDKITVNAITGDSNVFASDSCNMIASRWVSEPSSPFVHDYAVGVVGAGDYIYVATSDTYNNANTFMRYNTISGSWECLDVLWWYDGTRMDFKNGTAMAWDRGNYIYALCGASYSSTSNDMLFARYNISADKWETLPNSQGIQGAGDGLAVGSDGLVYAMTGRSDSGTPANTRPTVFARYNPATGTWDNTLTEPWANSDDGAALVAVGNKIYATQGEINEAFPEVYSFKYYNISDGNWYFAANFPKAESDGTSLAYDGGNYIYALGGSSQIASPEIVGDRFFRYSVSDNSWAELERIPTGVGLQNGARLGYSNGNMFYWVGLYSVGGYFDEAGKKLYRYPLNDYTVAVNVFPSPGVYSLSNTSVSEAQLESASGVLAYVVDVRNMGLKSDNYTLGKSDSATPDWGMALDTTQFTNVSSGLKVSAKLSVTVPTGASVGDVDNITVTATGTGTADSDNTQARKISMDTLPSKDSYTSEAFKPFNYGSSDNLYVGMLTGKSWRSYFQFNLSGIPSNVTQIKSAKLWVQCTAIDNNPTIEAYSTSDAWTETSIVWDNQSAPITLLDTLYVPRNTEGTWLVFDVTSLIQTEHAGDNIASVFLSGKGVLSNTYSSSIKLASKESTNENIRPKLVIEYEVPSPNQPWVATWSNKTGETSDDWATGVAVDGDYIYVGGMTQTLSPRDNTDIVLIKYNKDNVKQWENIWDNVHSTDWFMDVAVGTDAVYVVGYTCKSGDVQGVILKYDKTNGTLLKAQGWGTSDKQDIFCAVAVGSDGSVYVAGTTCSSTSFLLKYDSNLQIVHVPVVLSAAVINPGMEISVVGDNIYVCGWKFLAKYDSGLNKLAENAALNFYPWSVAVAGNSIYVAGWRGTDIAVLQKFTDSGASFAFQWESFFDNAGAQDRFLGVATLGSDVYVTGWTGDNVLKPDVILLKYNSSGAKQGQTNWGTANTYDSGAAIAIGSSGIYVVGATSTQGSDLGSCKEDILIWKSLIA